MQRSKGGLQRAERMEEGWGGEWDVREMAERTQSPHPALQVRRTWSTGKPLRMAVLPDTGSD